MAKRMKRYFSLLENLSKYINDNNLISNYGNGIKLDKELFDIYFRLAINAIIKKAIYSGITNDMVIDDTNTVFSLELSSKGVWCLVIWIGNDPILVIYPTSKFSPDEKIRISNVFNIPIKCSEKILVENASLFKILSTCCLETKPSKLLNKFLSESHPTFKKYSRSKHLLVESSKYLELYMQDYTHISEWLYSTMLRKRKKEISA